jgi:hypothetical protein
MRVVVLVLATLALAGCGQGSSTPGEEPSGAASLDISVSIGGKEAPTRVWTLRCPTGGTLPDAELACKNLDRLDDPFGRLPKSFACAEIYGGPQVAIVEGTFRGKAVNARFSRTDGCQIARWNRVLFLFPSS